MKKILLRLTIIIILIILLLPLSKIATKKRVIIIENQPTADRPAILTQEPELKRINTIFLGIAGEGNSAPNLTDTLMVMSADNNSEGFLLSIPRDLLVKIPDKNLYTKINALYQNYGIDAVQNLLTEITGLNFDYNIVIDLEGVRKIIDQVGGIDVFVEEDIDDPAFPGPNNSYEHFTLQKGLQHLNGETALKYIRTRHDINGDFSRMNRQQKVLVALKEKIASLHPLWNLTIIFDILKTLSGHLETNISIKDIKSFWKMAKNFNLDKIKFKTLDPTTELLVPDHTILGGETAYILKPKAGLNNYSEIREYVNKLINTAL